MKRSLTILAALIMATGLIASTVMAAGTQTVSPLTPGNWRAYVGGAGTTDLVNGPATPPLGTGSAHFVVTTGGDFAMVRTTDYDGTLLASLTKITYWTYVSTNFNCQATYVSLNLDTNADGVRDDQLNFEPCYQSGEYQDPLAPPAPLPVPDQCPDNPNDQYCFPKNTWVSWDAMIGAWWAGSQQTSEIVLTTIPRYLALHPAARIVGTVINSYQATVQQPINPDGSSTWSSKSKGAIPIFFKLQASAGIFGGFRLSNGDGWTGFNGNTDYLTVGVLGDDTSYDFEGVGVLPPAQGPLAQTCNLPAATIKVTKTGGLDSGDIDEVATTYQPDGGSNFRVVDCKYQYNLSIPTLKGSGNYRVDIQIDGNTVGSAFFELK